MRQFKGLFIDDDVSVCKTVKLLSAMYGLDFDVAYDVPAAQELLDKTNYDVISFDYNLTPGTTLELAREVAEKYPSPLIIIHTTDEDGAVELIKAFKGKCLAIPKTDLIMNLNRVLVELNSK